MARVSVIMPAYNGLKTVQKALTSLQTQTFSDLEIVVVDDQSTDGTWEFFQAAASEDPRIKLFRTPQNLGHGGASRLAVEKTTGEWITMLDTDDWWEMDRVDALLKASEATNGDMVIDNLRIFDHALGKIVRHTNYGSSRAITELTSENLFQMDNPLKKDSIGYCKPLIRTQFLREHNINYWGKYRDNEDFIFLSEIIIVGARTFIVPEAYYIYVHRVSPSSRKISSHSHSADNTALPVACACDELLEKYKSVLSTKASQALSRRKNIFLTSNSAGEQTKLFKQGQYGKALGAFLKYPSLWSYRIVGLRNRLGLKLDRST